MTRKETIKRDLIRYGLYGVKGFLRGLVIPGFLYIYFLRNAQYSNTFLKPFFKLILKILSFVFGFQIPSDVKIGFGFYLGHHGHVIINPEVVIGNNCAIAPGVTLGVKPGKKNAGCPKIGNFVMIGTNAVLVGGITIGDRVIIAPNSFINHDVPSDSVVIGNPARIIPKKIEMDDYFFHVIDNYPNV